MNKNIGLRKAIMVLAMVVLGFLPVVATQQQEGVMQITLDDALRLARELNPTLRIAQMGIERADAGINISRGRFLPSLSVSGAYTRNIKTPVIFLPPGSPFGDVLEIGSDNSYMATIVAGMPVFNPALNAALQTAIAERQLAGETLRASQLELEFFVFSAFVDVLLAKESNDVMQKSLEQATTSLEMVQNMTRQGLASEFDLIRARVQVENLRPNVMQAANGLRAAINYLRALIGLSEQQEVSVVGNLNQLSDMSLAQFSIIGANKNLSANPDLVQLDLQRVVLDRQVQSIRAAGLPSLSLTGNYNFQTEANDFRFADYRWVTTSAAGLRVSIPLFSGFTIRNQARQVELASQQLQLQRDYLAQNLNIQLQTILNTMTVARQRSQTSRETVNMATRGYEIALVRYHTGQSTLLELNDSELALTQARFNQIQAEHEFLRALAEYRRFIGEQ